MNDLTIKQFTALLEASPKRVPYFNDEQVIQCTACRAYFVNGKAWKSHRRTGTCDTTRLRQNAVGVWLPPRRIRVNRHNVDTTPATNTVADALESGLLTSHQKEPQQPEAEA